MDLNEISPVLQTIITAAATGFLAWAGMSARKAIKNYGKTNLEIAVAEMEAANKALLDAKNTPDMDDDQREQAKVELAREAVAHAQRVKAILDGFGEASSKRPPEIAGE